MSDIKPKSSTPLIKLLLADPFLPQKVRDSSPAELAGWINQIGLEDSGEILAFASSQQIQVLFDEDLWRPLNPGADEKFDAERFGVWLEIMSEIGPDKAIEKIVEMDEEFLVMAFSSLAWVARMDWLEENCQANSQIEKVIESRLTFEIDNFIIFGKVEKSWDVFISLLAALDTQNHSFLYGLLERCSDFLAQEAATEDDLYDILSDEEQCMDDVAYEREKRREAKGFVTPAVARSFFKLCEMALDVEDFVTPRHLLLKKLSASDEVTNGSLQGLTLNSQIPFRNVQAIFEKYPRQSELFMEQINFLANAVMSGWNWKSEERRPGRALEIVLEVCEQGIKNDPSDFSSFPRAFRVGWKKVKPLE